MRHSKDDIQSIIKDYKLLNDVEISNYKTDIFDVYILYHPNLADIKTYYSHIHNKLSDCNYKDIDKVFPNFIKENLNIDEQTVSLQVFSGLIVIIDVENSKVYSIDINSIPSRSISESISDPLTMDGAREGFIENIRINIAMMRNKLKTKDLKFELIDVGTKSKTTVAVSYLDGLASRKLIKEITKRINDIEIDYVVNLVSIVNGLNVDKEDDSSKMTGSVSKAIESLVEGKVVVLVDGSPNALVMPFTVIDAIATKDETDKIPSAIFARVLGTLLVQVSLFLPAIYVALISTHTSFLTFISASTLAVSRVGIPFSILWEEIIVMMTFEIFYFISMKSNKMSVQQVIMTIGGLLLGQNLIASAIASPHTMVITAISYMTTFNAIKYGKLTNKYTMIRIFSVIVAYLAGFVGIVFAVILTTTKMYNTKSFGISHLHPFAPFNYKALKKFITADNETYNEDTLEFFRKADD